MNKFYLILVACTILFSCKKTENNLSRFQIEPGYRIDLIASEPILLDPVDLEFDLAGEAYALEMPGYPLEDVQSRIIYLSDQNDDGVYDHRTIYADKLQMASSLLSYEQGFLVAAPPYLLYVSDADGDHKADRRDTILGGFATGNLQHNYNGLLYGLDGWIYASNGGNSGKPFWWPDSTHTIDLKGQDIRINIRLHKMERNGRSSGGFGMTMDDYGHLFETHNTDHINQSVFSQRYIGNVKLLIPHTLKNISNHDEDGLARIYPIGDQETRVNHPEQSGYVSGACGINFNGGNILGEHYKNTVWEADVVLNLLHVDLLSDKGCVKVANRLLQGHDFLASSDRAFRPVNLVTGPDGALYVIDIHRDVIEHPEWIPDDIEKTLDLKAGKDKGRIYRISQFNDPVKPIRNTWSANPIGALGSNNQWVRKNAQRILQNKSLDQDELKSLDELLMASDPMPRLHALWTLYISGNATSHQLLQGLNDLEPGNRENSILIAESFLNDTAVLNKLIQLINDDDQRVRMQAALSVSLVDSVNFVKYAGPILHAILEAAHKPLDEYNVAAYTLASKRAPITMMKALLPDDVAFIKSLALNTANSLDIINQALYVISQKIKDQKILASILESYQGINDQSVARAILPSFEKIEKKGGDDVIKTIAIIRSNLGLPASGKYLELARSTLTDILANKSNDSELLNKVKLLEPLDYKEKGNALFTCLDEKYPAALQSEVLSQLNKIKQKEIGTRLVSIWTTLSPSSKNLAGDILLHNKMHHETLLDALENHIITIGEMNFDLERRRTLLWWDHDPNIKRRAAALFKDSEVNTRDSALQKMKPALLLTGDAVKGEKVFASLCSACHQYGKLGHSVGPNLTEISRKSKELILHDVVDPNAVANTQFIKYIINSSDGRETQGIIDSDTDVEIILKNMNEVKSTIAKKDIRTIKSTGKSLMPEGLEANMTLQEMADLLEYLRSK